MISFTKRLFDNAGDHISLSGVNTVRFQKLSDKLGFKIIGCDLTDAEELEAGKRLCAMFPQRYRYEELYNQIRRIDDSHYDLLNLEELALDADIMVYRNYQMVKMITKYEALSEKPIIVIMGGTHEDEISENMLRKKKFGHAYIKQHTFPK